MTYIYQYAHEHTQSKEPFDALREAIYSAAVDMELGSAWPEKITGPDGSALWEQSGPLTTHASLNRFAMANAVQWP